MRAAVVALGISDRWDEMHVVARRMAGALAHDFDVEILLPGAAEIARHEGVFDVREFPAAPRDARRARVLSEVLASSPHRSAASPSIERLEEELVLARGEWSPALVDHLSRTPYEVVVLIGAGTGVAWAAIEALDDSTPVVAVPCFRSRHDAAALPAKKVLGRASVVAAVTPVERDEAQHLTTSDVVEVGFVVRTNDLAAVALPGGFPDLPPVVVACDWTASDDVARWARWARMIREDTDGQVSLRALGPAANRVPEPLAGESGSSRIDHWRWMSHAVAVIDPAPHRPTGIVTLEAMTFGVPVIAPSDSGASVRHVDLADGGLWYRTYDELLAAARLLLDSPEVARRLGEQGQTYAREHYGDSRAFVENVRKLAARVR